ncbi:hypothetical protein DRN72_01960 [Methanosarcinales archaeon]|nr:MAG: hypothetical protein DRN72_01960 [Methanosarcinales archaeon]
MLREYDVMFESLTKSLGDSSSALFSPNSSGILHIANSGHREIAFLIFFLLSLNAHSRSLEKTL